MTGQMLFSTTHRKCYREEFVFIRALQGHSVNDLDIRREVSRKSGGRVAGGVGPSKGRMDSVLFNCLATGTEFRPEVQAVHPFQESSWPVFET